MSTPTPAPREPQSTLDLIEETAWRLWVRHRHVPHDSNERALFSHVVAQVWQMMMSERQPSTQHGSETMPGNGRTRLALAILTLVLGAGIPSAGAIQGGSWAWAAVGAGGFLLGVVAAWLTPWGKR